MVALTPFHRQSQRMKKDVSEHLLSLHQIRLSRSHHLILSHNLDKKTVAHEQISQEILLFILMKK